MPFWYRGVENDSLQDLVFELRPMGMGSGQISGSKAEKFEWKQHVMVEESNINQKLNSPSLLKLIFFLTSK